MLQVNYMRKKDQDVTRTRRITYNLRSPRFFAPSATFFTAGFSTTADGAPSTASLPRLTLLTLRFLPGEVGFSDAGDAEAVLEKVDGWSGAGTGVSVDVEGEGPNSVGRVRGVAWMEVMRRARAA